MHALLDKEGITGEQLYNCDESGLNFKMLPTKSLASREEKSAPGYKRSKERVTILACSNATGNHKLKLVFIGKSKKPRAFKNLSASAFPVTYKNQKNAWMDMDIFREWFFKEFVPSVKMHLTSLGLPNKAVLLMDSAPCHPDNNELISGDIRAMFLPTNCTSLCQPMDQGVFATLKKLYRRKFLSNLTNSLDEGNNFTETLRKINMKDVMFWIAECWNNIPPDTLPRSWKILLSNEERQDIANEHLNNDLTDLLKKIPGCEDADNNDITEWMRYDEQYELTDSDIITMVNVPEVEDSEECDHEKELENEEKVSTHSEAVKIFEAALAYTERQPEATPTDIMVMRRWLDIAAKKRVTSGKQTSIKDFFCK